MARRVQIQRVMAYVTRKGRRLRLAPGVTNGIQRLVQLDGTVATFECIRRGHRMTHDYSKGPVPKRIGALALERVARYWAKDKHIHGWCQRCQNLEDLNREE